VREHLLRNRMISEEDLGLYHVTDDPVQAAKLITRFYRNFHSTRFVREQLVIRLKNAPPPSALAGLNQDFADIITGEPMHITEALPDEREDNDYVELPRLAFGFDRRSYSRLRQLIDVLNNY
jgi:hypothetical protein